MQVIDIIVYIVYTEYIHSTQYVQRDSKFGVRWGRGGKHVRTKPWIVF